MLELRVVRQLGALRLEVELAAASTGTLALFGESGSGKTSILNLLAGLTRPDAGRIALDGVTLFDSARRIDVPPERRRLGYVFQDGRLFPHLTVQANLRYGERRLTASARRIGFDRIVGLLGLEPLLARRPADLSGGEKQRVAIGRALLASPRLLLLDEPLASLDVGRRQEVLPFIQDLRAELDIPIVYVSHEMSEILQLADTLALVAQGRIAAVGAIDEILGRPELRPLTGGYDAGGVLETRVDAQDDSFNLTHLGFGGGTLRVARLDLPVGATLRVRVRARDIALALEPPQRTSFLNVLPGRVVATAVEDATYVDVQLDVGAPLWSRITARSASELRLAPGASVYALIKAVAIDPGSVARRTPQAGSGPGGAAGTPIGPGEAPRGRPQSPGRQPSTPRC